jgi:putative cell wall-binding protein
VTESGGSTDISEVGPTGDDYTVVLTSTPTDNVVVGIFPDAQETTNLSLLTFTPVNWNVPQTVVTTAIADGIVECSHTGLIAHAATSADPTYNGIGVASVVPNINDVCKRVPGSDPKTQAIEVSKHRFPSGGANAAIIARDDLIVDTFTGIPFASLRRAPILLTPSGALDANVSAELKRVLTSPSAPIYILGREEAIEPIVYDQLRIAGFSNLVQIGGAHRRETAALIARHIFATQGTATRAFITEDERLVDALGAGAIAGNRMDDGLVDPILLSERGSSTLDPNTDFVLRTQKSISSLEIVGAEDALPLSLDSALATRYTHVKSIKRTGGSDRFDTNALLAERFHPAPDGVVVANGEKRAIPGALSLSSVATLSESLFGALLGGTIAADEGQPLLIVRTDEVPRPIITYLTAHEATISGLIIVGDFSLVSQAVEKMIKVFI